MKTQTILITGATSGIGRTTALHLAARGHTVFAAGRRVHALESLKREDPRIHTVELDVTKQESIDSAHEQILAETGGHGLDVLVNNAGYGHLTPIALVTDAELRAQYETNVFGLMAMTRKFLPEMQKRGSGRIINTSSVGGRVTMPFFGAYNSTKHAVESLSDAMRYELTPFGIHTVLIEPGLIKTEFVDHSMELLEKHNGEDNPYQAIYERSDEVRSQMDAMSVGPEVIARAIRRAVESRRPRARYVAPFRTYFWLGFMKFLPTRWVDAALRMSMGLTRKGLRLKKSQTPAAAA